MNIRANTEFKFLVKYLLIGIACFAFALWSLYDGLVTFPNQIPRAEAWEKLDAEVPDGPVDSEAWDRISAEHGLVLDSNDQTAKSKTDNSKSDLWKLIAKKNGWNKKTLKKDESVSSIEHKVNSQFLFLGIGLIIGVPCLIWFFRNRGTWIESTEDGLRASWGQELKCSQIKTFDKKKWEKKGIGVLSYTDSQGAEKKFALDDLKYERQPMDQIVAWMESQISAEKIINGDPESAADELDSEDEPIED